MSEFINLLQQAEEYLKAGRYREGITIYRKLLADHPEEESILLSLAWAYHDGGDTEQAIDCFERLFENELARKVFTGFAYDELVRIYKSLRQYDRLVDVCERAADVQPQDVALLGELGEAFLKAGKIAESIKILKKLLEMAPDEPICHCRLGDALLAEGNFIEAEASYDRAAEIDPAAACSFYSRLGDRYLRARENERAEKAFRKCLEIGRDNPLYHCAVGDCLIGRGKLAEAQAAYETAMALSPDSAGALYNRWGNALAAACCPERLLKKSFFQAVQKCPEAKPPKS